MRVPRALMRENAAIAVFRCRRPSNRVRLGFEMLRLTARCCGEDENVSGARAITVRCYSSALVTASDAARVRVKDSKSTIYFNRSADLGAPLGLERFWSSVR